MATNNNPSAQAIAINRFGLGAQLNQALPTMAPQQWLLAQLDQYQAKPSAWSQQATSEAILNRIGQIQTKDMNKADKQAFRRQIRDDYADAVEARALSALNTTTPFVERLVHFWSNHFAISIQKPAVTDLAGAYELEAIRPNVLGSFKDLLLAVEQHPAMLLYLDQAKSTGPNSLIAQRASKRKPDKKIGLNENLAREILELHTLGVRSGYTQQDVTEFAKALTGWSVMSSNNIKLNNMRQNKKVQASIKGKHGFEYRPLMHEPGERLILGKRYEQAEQGQAIAVLSDLANSTATAKHIATKLARHFVSDHPPASLIETLTQAFVSSGGNLSQVYRVLINAPETWETSAQKFKTPWEWLISSFRGLGKQDLANFNVTQMLNQLGQPIWKPGSPAGYDDIADAWASPNSLMRRVETAQRLVASSARRLDARQLTNQLLLGGSSTATLTQIQRAESASTALALLLVSPEFLRR